MQIKKEKENKNDHKKETYNYLNGLRGYGAFAVFIYHAKYEFRYQLE
jgi:hypothetical protein